MVSDGVKIRRRARPQAELQFVVKGVVWLGGVGVVWWGEGRLARDVCRVFSLISFIFVWIKCEQLYIFNGIVYSRSRSV